MLTVTPQILLNQLPPYRDSWVLVKEKQTVTDIISLIVKQHKEFAPDYDLIGVDFLPKYTTAASWRGTDKEVNNLADNIFDFCETYLRYVEESEDFQSVGNPASILMRGGSGVDCKSYALFIGGCLDAIQRATGAKIDWFYRFASYEIDVTTPYHVFIAVNAPGGLVYIDPTPGSANKEPVWIVDKRVHVKAQTVHGVNNAGALVAMNDCGCGCNDCAEKIGAVVPVYGSDPSWGVLMTPPTWYPAYLPRFYNNGDGFRLRPLNAVPGYTSNDVLDVAIYLQTLIGYNRTDWQNARSAAWQYSNGSGGAQIWIKAALQKDSNGDGSGNFAKISNNNQSIDGAFYAAIQARYIEREKVSKPWLADMQGKGGGIDLMTIPMASDIEQPRPSFYPAYLPGLFMSQGEYGQYPAGHLDTKPKIRNGKSSGWTEYDVTPCDIAALMLYVAPVELAGPTPYPVNWYVNDDVNGAMSMYFKISLGFIPGHTNAQMQMTYGIAGDLMQQPNLDADPYASGFTHTLQTIVSAAINFFAGKIPGGAKAVQAAYLAGSIGGGELITGGPMPAGAFSAAVFQCANTLAETLKQQTANKKNLLLLLLIAAGVAVWYYQDEINDYL